LSFSPEQCRAARALLNWPQTGLAEAADVAVKTLVDYERGKRVPFANNLAALQRALEAAGVIFVDENGEGAGIRMRKFRAGDIVRLREAGQIAGIKVGKDQTGIVTVVEVDTETLGSKYRLTVRFGEVPIPLKAKDVELVAPALDSRG
jgi:transcriptional regulator with XRE-family HTH domain